MDPTDTVLPAETAEFLSFRVGDQDYTVDIMSVREIRGWSAATALPRAPSYVRGVINLRGIVLPILDLADRLGLPATDTTERNVIIVVQSDADTVGLLVDAVSDILTVSTHELQSPPAMTEADSAFVQALIVDETRLIRVLDLQATLAPTLKDTA